MRMTSRTLWRATIRFFAYDHKCFGILLDKSDVKKEDILLKVGIQDINEKGETYYEFI